MKRYVIPKQADQTWIVTSGARLLPASLRMPMASPHPVPRPVQMRPRPRRHTPTRQSLIPLSRRPVFYDR